MSSFVLGTVGPHFLDWRETSSHLSFYFISFHFSTGCEHKKRHTFKHHSWGHSLWYHRRNCLLNHMAEPYIWGQNHNLSGKHSSLHDHQQATHVFPPPQAQRFGWCIGVSQLLLAAPNSWKLWPTRRRIPVNENPHHNLRSCNRKWKHVQYTCASGKSKRKDWKYRCHSGCLCTSIFSGGQRFKCNWHTYPPCNLLGQLVLSRSEWNSCHPHFLPSEKPYNKPQTNAKRVECGQHWGHLHQKMKNTCHSFHEVNTLVASWELDWKSSNPMLLQCPWPHVPSIYICTTCPRCPQAHTETW